MASSSMDDIRVIKPPDGVLKALALLGRCFADSSRPDCPGTTAVVAAARKLACLFWCLLSREEDYAYQQPSLTQKKLRLLEIRAGAPPLKGTRHGDLGDEAEDARGRARARRTRRGRLRAHRLRLAANADKEEGRRRDTGARI
jgi:hypothetical protein